MAVHFVSYSKLEQFINSWDSVLAGMMSDPGHDILETIFHGQIKGSTVFAHDLAYYRRLQKGHEDRSYAWLRGMCIRYLDMKRQDENREAVRRGIAGGTPSAAARRSRDELLPCFHPDVSCQGSGCTYHVATRNFCPRGPFASAGNKRGRGQTQ
jgi:hypothetical protein